MVAPMVAHAHGHGIARTLNEPIVQLYPQLCMGTLQVFVKTSREQQEAARRGEKFTNKAQDLTEAEAYMRGVNLSFKKWTCRGEDVAFRVRSRGGVLSLSLSLLPLAC
eukprot:scaffold8110_cov403-Prasinococcus_capsulatus_cf.AAC.7